MDVNELIGEFIKKQRLERRMTQTELGKKLGVATSTMCQYEKGQRKIDLETYYLLCQILRITPNEIKKYLDENISR